MRSLLVCAALFLLSTACAHTHDVDVAPTGTVSDAGANLAPPVGKWRLVAFADVDVAPAAEVTLVVQDDGKIAGSGGCNGYFGTWALGEGKDSIGPVGATRRMCQTAVMDVETKYFDALSRVGGWRATDAGIALTDAAGNALMTLRATD